MRGQNYKVIKPLCLFNEVLTSQESATKRDYNINVWNVFFFTIVSSLSLSESANRFFYIVEKGNVCLCLSPIYCHQTRMSYLNKLQTRGNTVRWANNAPAISSERNEAVLEKKQIRSVSRTALWNGRLVKKTAVLMKGYPTWHWVCSHSPVCSASSVNVRILKPLLRMRVKENRTSIDKTIFYVQVLECSSIKGLFISIGGLLLKGSYVLRWVVTNPNWVR